MTRSLIDVLLLKLQTMVKMNINNGGVGLCYHRQYSYDKRYGGYLDM